MCAKPMPQRTLPSTGPVDDPIKPAWKDVVLHKRATQYQVRDVILNSWHLCLKNNLDPRNPQIPPVLNNEQLFTLRSANRDLIQIANPVMKMIEISVKGTGFIVTLSERQGIVLEVRGDKDILGMAQRTFYMPGCDRSTEKAGTNAIGLSLDAGEPFQVTGAEHFNIHHHPWTCSSAPIRNSQGDIIGAITLSGRSVGQHKHTLALVTTAANTIEGQLRERDLIEGTQRLNSILTSIYHAISDGFIALDNEHIITHLNSAASRMLGIEINAAVGRPLNEVAKPDDKLMKALDSGDHMEATESTFQGPKGICTYMCRVDPVHTSDHRVIGNIITMAEQSQMINIAKKIGGNYAKYDFADIKGENAAFRRQIEIAKLAAKTHSKILITGESGTGKELFAQAIHNYSHRSNGPFVAISCAAIPRDLIESELFGYKGGAFTGARQKGMIGKFELANGGTLFLDEIDGMPFELQGKLLRVLQQNEVMRLGDTRTIPIDVRVVAASNTNILKEVEHGGFREDLYYRLNVMEINIPPLRERLDDLERLIQYMMKRHCRQMGINEMDLSAGALKRLKSYTWPGNVRELENVVERALLLCRGKTILEEHLPLRPIKRTARGAHKVVTLHEGSKDIIESALERCHGNVSRAANELRIARSTLYRKMERLGIPK